MDILERVNENTIAPIEMEEYLKRLAKRGDQSFETQVFVALQAFPASKRKRFSIGMRMHALSELLVSEGLPGWVKPTDSKGIVNVAENIYFAAGLEPVIEVERRLGFNKDSLLKRAFQLNLPRSG